jgi:hypothetical protein
MLFRNVQLLSDYTILAKDGEIGKIYDFLFDDTTWTIRYLVGDTGHWLPGRRVLLSPTSVKKSHWESQQFELNLTRDQVQKSPNIHTAKPVSLQHQIQLHDYYGWPYYWTAGGFTPIYPPLIPPSPEKEPDTPQSEDKKGDPHLRSTKEVMGYHIQAIDGEIGHVEDFLVDDESWAIHYMVVDTKNWLPGRKVLVSPEWIKQVDWAERKVTVYLTQEAVKNSPEYYPTEPVSQEYEDRLYKYYGLSKTRGALLALAANRFPNLQNS